MKIQDIEKTLAPIAESLKQQTMIDAKLYQEHNVKRGLRNENGTGVLVGMTRVGEVVGYTKEEGKKIPCDGQVYYRGYALNDLVEGFQKEKRLGFEEIIYLLLFAKLPSSQELKDFNDLLDECRDLPSGYKEDVILKIPASNIMNKLQRAVLTLYSYDEKADDTSVLNVLRQSIELIAKLPLIAAYSYQVKRYAFHNESLHIHRPLKGVGTAANFLRLIRIDGKYTQAEEEILDLLLVIQAEHGGGNNSSFATHVVSSTGTDTYSAISTALGALKGPKHGGANQAVEAMINHIKENVGQLEDDVALRDYLKRILNKEVFDQKGLIYGLGHAVYTLSDPRTKILKEKARNLVKGLAISKDLELRERIEKIGCELINAKLKEDNKVSANVDFYAGFVLAQLGIPEELYTPVFAISRIAGWSAHRLEQILDDKIMRPAYVTLTEHQNYTPLNKR